MVEEWCIWRKSGLIYILEFFSKDFGICFRALPLNTDLLGMPCDWFNSCACHKSWSLIDDTDKYVNCIVPCVSSSKYWVRCIINLMSLWSHDLYNILIFKCFTRGKNSLISSLHEATWYLLFYNWEKWDNLYSLRAKS